VCGVVAIDVGGASGIEAQIGKVKGAGQENCGGSESVAGDGYHETCGSAA
jgi:hypothetical protein